MKRIVTASQTVGPFFHRGVVPIPPLSAPEIPGERIVIGGRLLDGAGAGVGDGLLETWQANGRGKYAHPADGQDKQTTPGFTGFGRTFTGKDGSFRIETIRPGAVPWLEAGQQAPHINVLVFARGLLRHLVTRMYFHGDPLLAADPVLQLVRDAKRRETLLARQDASPPGAYRWDIVLQGARETVFFDC